ncbi:hypothetical protein HRG_003436 [Hirsutella rhossiliensis]|uniref:Uncharacterized protein n=1 Tax=Hirsutella rhossiliensis TaxID=111463 RepID=A0A9P8SL38_9HYPO|nr:uncharacterized protein HRG_03436 [Hirsutella rhossiliensis]KAH0965420.1 hypothetical protein HRG_03436 [Hirsutella rhossiliensis]
MAELSSPKATPKRKRGEQQLPATPIKFSFNPSGADSPKEGSNSPRSIVAHRFRGLALGGDDQEVETADLLTRKRLRPDLDLAAADSDARPEPFPTSLPQPDVAIASTEAASVKALPVVDRPPEPKSPRRKRAGTPPLRLKKSPAKDPQVPIADPVRAALTWHEDEITIYDPDDDDDDGTGINGIGFKPTPALAHARAMKRRQQMADYRRREESEARTKRSQRRMADAAVPSGRVVKKKSPTQRVRFVDAESHKVAVTTA